MRAAMALPFQMSARAARAELRAEVHGGSRSSCFVRMDIAITNVTPVPRRAIEVVLSYSLRLRLVSLTRVRARPDNCAG